jgi:hypothetical protein
MRPLLFSLAAWFSLASAAPSAPSTCAADASDTDRDPRAILLRAIKAHGGDRLARLRIVREQSRGTVTIQDTKVPFTQETLLRMPDQFRVSQSWESRGRKVTVVQTFDGSKGWLTEAGVPRPVDDKMLANWKELAHANLVMTLRPLLAADKGFRLTALGEVEVKGKKVLGVKVSFEGRRDVSLYFDRESGLLVRRSFQPRPGGKETIQDELYSDFKEVEGVKRPMRVVILLGGVAHADVAVVATHFPERVADKEFSKP